MVPDFFFRIKLFSLNQEFATTILKMRIDMFILIKSKLKVSNKRL